MSSYIWINLILCDRIDFLSRLVGGDCAKDRAAAAPRTLSSPLSVRGDRIRSRPPQRTGIVLHLFPIDLHAFSIS
jgi:hypothetical protein